LARKLINYLPEVLRNFREFEKTFESEEPEFEKLQNELSKVLKDLFVEDATERGVKRWEKLLKIVPKPSETLEDRKFKILSKLIKKLPYTRRRLEQLLEVLCGENGYLLEIVEGTTNLIPSNRLKFEGWTAYQGASVTVEQGYSIPDITPDGATRIQTSGGTSTTKYYTGVGPGDAGTPASYRVWVRNIGDKPVEVFGNVIYVSNIVYPGETKLCTGSTKAVNGTVNRQMLFRTLDVDDSLDFIVYQPQIEEKPYPTPFVSGTRLYNYTVKVQVALARKNMFDDVKILLQEIIPANHIVDLSLLYNQHFTVAQYKHGELSTWTHDYIRSEVLS
jgi:hypothetical protein